MIRIVLIDDHAVVRTGYRRLLSAEPDFEVVGEAPYQLDASSSTRFRGTETTPAGGGRSPKQTSTIANRQVSFCWSEPDLAMARIAAIRCLV